MNDPRNALTPRQAAELWQAIDQDTQAIRQNYLAPNSGTPGATRLTQACAFTACAVMLDAGLRPCELATLLFADFQMLDGPQAWLNVRAEVSKSHRARQLSCTNRLTTRVAVHRALAERNPTLLTPLVLAARPQQRKPISTRTIQRWINEVTRQALFVAVPPYWLRHTYATLLLKVADIETVRQALGHRHISTTQTYLHTQSDSHRSAATRFETATNGD